MPRVKSERRSKRRSATPLKSDKHARSVSASVIGHGIRTRILSLLMLILVSSIGFWFFGFVTWSVVAWIVIVIFGGYVIFEYDLSIAKAVIALSVIVMELFTLNGTSNLFVIGSVSSVMFVTFVVLDIILFFALSKL